MLGPSIMFGSPPFCVGYALNTCLFGKARVVPIIALALAIVELLMLIMLIVVAVMHSGT